MDKDHLKRAITICHGQTALAKKINENHASADISQAHIWNWLHRDARVPAEYVIAIEKATNSKVTRHQLRPDIYPEGVVA